MCRRKTWFADQSSLGELSLVQLMLPRAATKRGPALSLATLAALGVMSIPARGDAALEEQSKDSNATLEEVVVKGAAVQRLDLDSVAKTGSRLGLNAMETPAAVEAIGLETMMARGLKTIDAAADSMAGVNSGADPGTPSTFSMRGFTGGAITNLRDGTRAGPTGLTTRPQNTFNLERVEILKGPASVLYGEGAVAGTINTVTKQPVIGRSTAGEVLLSYGRYDAYEVGVGVGGPIGGESAYRLDFSRHDSDHWVDDISSYSSNLTAAVLWEPTQSVRLLFSADYLEDQLPSYWGTPLVPASFATRTIGGVVSTSDGWVLDERMRFKNYEAPDHTITSDQLWTRASVEWQASNDISVRGQIYNLTADREWKVADFQVFDPPTGLIQRDRFITIHDQKLSGGRLELAFDKPLAGMEHRFLVGMDYSDMDYNQKRGFIFADAVDPLDPTGGAGLFDGVQPSPSDTLLKSTAVFFEDALDVFPGLKLITGARFDHLALDRRIFDTDGTFLSGPSFEDKYDNASWRIGAVYELAPQLVAYGQLSTGQSPASGGDFFLVDESTNFELTDVMQWEIGLKARLADGRAEVTAAYYDIVQKNIVTQISQTELSNVGQQESRGLELAGSAEITQSWSLSANVAYTDAEYVNFVDPSVGIDASGNRPPNVAPWTANLWTSIGISGLPLEVGGGLRYVGNRYSNLDNTVKLESYTVGNVFAVYSWGRTRIMARVNNVFDKVYTRWTSEFNPRQIILASPRAAEVSVFYKF